MRQGIALITAVVLSLIVLLLSLTLIFMSKSSIFIAGSEKRYTSSLEVNKGIANYIIQNILDGSLECNTPDRKCSANSTIDLGSLSSIGDYRTTAKVLNILTLPDGSKIYSVEVETINSKTKEKSVVDFVYKLE